MGPDYETELGTPRQWAAAVLGSWSIEPVWRMGDAGWPAPGELDRLQVDIELASGQAHLLQTNLDQTLSASWCPEEVGSAALVVQVQDEAGVLWAADPKGQPTAWLGPGPRGEAGEETRLTAALAVQRYPSRWSTLPETQYQGAAPTGFEISTPLPGSGIDTLAVQVMHEIPEVGGEVVTGNSFVSLVGTWQQLP